MRALGLLLLATAIAAAAAVPCSNFATEAECNASATSSGQCGWQGGACVVVAPLPPGMAGIATVGPEEEVVPVGAPAAADAPAPAPEVRRRRRCSFTAGCRGCRGWSAAARAAAAAAVQA